jgi:fused signal recognition particle receptor
MTRKTLKPEPRTEIAAAIFAGALAVLALTQIPARAPEAVSAPDVSMPAAPTVVPAAVAVANLPEPLRSASYYPEHLAALQSLSGFQPMADAGDKSAPHVTLGPGGKPVFEPKAQRRLDAPAKTASAPQPGPLAQATQPAVTPPQPVAESPVRIFGMPLPGPAELGAQMNAQAANLRDTAGRWGAAASGLGAKVADLWRH